MLEIEQAEVIDPLHVQEGGRSGGFTRAKGLAVLFASRVLSGVLVVAAAALLVFLVIRLAPGDPARELAGGIDARPEQVEQARHLLGLDQPLYTQFGSWLWNALQGDLGNSYLGSQSVTSLIAARLPVTGALALGGLLVALVIALPLGVLAGVRKGTGLDRGIMAGTSLGVATPSFVLGILLVGLFATRWGVLPATGFAPLQEGVVPWIEHLILPSLALGLALASELTRHVRASFSDELRKDYVRTASAKGLPFSTVLRRHVTKNASTPVVTIVGLQTAVLLGGTVVVEQVFALPGLGTLLVNSVFRHDYPVVIGIAIFTSIVVTVVNLLVEFLYLLLMPHLTLG